MLPDIVSKGAFVCSSPLGVRAYWRSRPGAMGLVVCCGHEACGCTLAEPGVLPQSAEVGLTDEARRMLSDYFALSGRNGAAWREEQEACAEHQKRVSAYECEVIVDSWLLDRSSL